MLDFVSEQLSAHVEKVRAMVVATRASPDAESVHQLRVSIRRLTETVRSLEEWVKPRRAAKLRARLRPVMKAAGVTRNLDIACDLCLEAPVASADGVGEALKTARVVAAHRLVGRLLALRLDKLRPPCEPNPDAPAPRVLAAALMAELIPRYWRSGRVAAQPEASWTELHQFRLATKQLRYTMELFASIYPRGIPSRLDVLKKVQTHLGKVNDCDAARGLKAIARDAALDAWLAERQQTEREEFVKTWAEEQKRSRAGANWVGYFARPK